MPIRFSQPLEPNTTRSPGAADPSAAVKGLGPTASAAELTALARAMDARGQNFFDGLSVADRRAALAAVLGVAGQAPEKRAERELERQAGTSALLVRLLTAKGKGGAEVARQAWEALVAICREPADPGVRNTALGALYAQKQRLPAEVRRLMLAEVHKSAKTTPPYAAWEQPDGSRRIRMVLNAQDEFYAEWIPVIEKRLKFELVSEEGKTRHYRRTVEHDGKRTDFTLTLAEKEGDTFAPLGDPKVDVAIDSQHSDWWARIHRDMRHAPNQVGEKVLVNFMCFGRHFLPDIVPRYPDLHVVTSRDPMESPEECAGIEAMLAGFARGASWSEIAADASKDRRNPEDNVLFPCDLPKLAYALDEDGDGRVNALDTVFDQTPPERLSEKVTAADFAPQDGVDPGNVSGRKVLEAGLLLNGVSYDHELLDAVNIDQRVRADGWFTPKPGDRRVIDLDEAEVGGKKALRLRVSDRYAHAHPAALVGMTTFEGVLALLARHPDRLSGVDWVLSAIATLAHVTDNDRYPGGATVYRHTLEHYGLPVLRRTDVLSEVAASPAWESGSARTIKRLRARLTDEQRAAIEAFAATLPGPSETPSPRRTRPTRVPRSHRKPVL